MGRFILALIFITGLVFLIAGAREWMRKTPEDDSLEDKLKNGEEAKTRVKDLNKKYNRKK